MSEHRSVFAPVVGSSSPRSRRWVIAAVSAIGVSGLIFGGLLAPVSADDVAGDVSSEVSAEFDGNCVKATVGGDGADGSVSPQGDGASSGLDVTADGTGTSEVSVCRDDLGGGLPEDPGGGVPGDPGGALPGDVDETVDGVVEAILSGDPGGAVPGDPGGAVPGDPGGAVPGDPGGAVPGDPGGAVPGDPGDPGDGLVPVAVGLLSDLLDRAPHVLPDLSGTDGPGDNTGNDPAISTSASGTGSASVDVGGAGEGSGAPGDQVLGGELERGGPGSTDTAVLPAGGTLPRTGGGLGSGLLRMIAVLGLGRAGLSLAGRRRAAAVGNG